jgi:hypothetical protein
MFAPFYCLARRWAQWHGNSKRHWLNSLREHLKIFVGHGFSHDIRAADSARLQPLPL